MADQIEITNVGGQGVASEITLQRLQKTMALLAKEVGKDANSQSAKLQKAYEKSLKDSTKAVDNSTDAYEDNASAVRSASRALGGVAGFLGGAVMGALSSLTGSAVGMSKELLTGSNRLTDFAQHVPLVGGVLSMFTGALDNSIDQLRSLSSVGASFNNDFEDMLRTMVDAEMPFDDFAQTILNNTQSMAALGTSVTNGTLRFAQLSRDLRVGDLGANLMSMGFTVNDINDGLARYTLMQARSGRLQDLNNRELREGTAAYLQEVDALAKATGMQRDEAMEAMLEQQTDAQIRAVQREIEARGGNVEAFNAQIGILENLSPELKGAFRQLIDGIPDDEMGEMLMTATNGQAGALMEQVRSGNITTQEFYDRLRAFGPQIEAAFGDADLIGGLRRLNHPMATLTDSAFSLLQMQDKNLDEIEEEQRRRDRTTSAIAQFEQAMNSIRSEVLIPLVNQFLPPFKDFMEKTFTSENIQTYVTHFRNFMAELTEDPKGRLMQLWEDMKTGFMDAMFGEEVDGERIGGLYADISTAVTSLFNDLKEPITDTLKSMWKYMLDEIILYLADNTIFFGDAADEIRQSREEAAALAAATEEEIMAARESSAQGANPDATPLERAVEKQELADPNSATNRAWIADEIGYQLDRYNSASLMGSPAAQDHLRFLNQAIGEFTGAGGTFTELPTEIQNAFPEDLKFTRGTGGFRDFGKGTLAMLHGEEAVVPKDSAAGQLLTNGPQGATINNQEGVINAVNELNSTMRQAAGMLQDIKQLTKKQLGATRDMGAVY